MFILLYTIIHTCGFLQTFNNLKSPLKREYRCTKIPVLTKKSLRNQTRKWTLWLLCIVAPLRLKTPPVDRLGCAPSSAYETCWKSCQAEVLPDRRKCCQAEVLSSRSAAYPDRPPKQRRHHLLTKAGLLRFRCKTRAWRANVPYATCAVQCLTLRGA